MHVFSHFGSKIPSVSAEIVLAFDGSEGSHWSAIYMKGYSI